VSGPNKPGDFSGPPKCPHGHLLISEEEEFSAACSLCPRDIRHTIEERWRKINSQKASQIYLQEQ
jgi:hypothetical protein